MTSQWRTTSTPFAAMEDAPPPRASFPYGDPGIGPRKKAHVLPTVSSADSVAELTDGTTKPIAYDALCNRAKSGSSSRIDRTSGRSFLPFG